MDLAGYSALGSQETRAECLRASEVYPGVFSGQPAGYGDVVEVLGGPFLNLR
jgi:hypothetical protein